MMYKKRLPLLLSIALLCTTNIYSNDINLSEREEEEALVSFNIRDCAEGTLGAFVVWATYQMSNPSQKILSKTLPGDTYGQLLSWLGHVEIPKTEMIGATGLASYAEVLGKIGAASGLAVAATGGIAVIGYLTSKITGIKKLNMLGERIQQETGRLVSPKNN